MERLKMGVRRGGKRRTGGLAWLGAARSVVAGLWLGSGGGLAWGAFLKGTKNKGKHSLGWETGAERELDLAAALRRKLGSGGLAWLGQHEEAARAQDGGSSGAARTASTYAGEKEEQRQRKGE